MTTKPKCNADFSPKTKGLCIFKKSLIPIVIENGFSFEQAKTKLDLPLPKRYLRTGNKL